MAGINDYRRAGQYNYGGFYDQGDPSGVGDEGVPLPPPLPGQSGRSSSRAGEYYGAGSRAISPYAAQGGAQYSPRLGYPYPYQQLESEGYRSGAYTNRNFTLNLNNTPNNGYSPSDSPEDPNIQTVAAKGAGLIAIVVENLLSHPFLVLKRQCQVHTSSKRYHLFPFTMVNPVFHICQRQGVAVLWKGLGSTLVVRGMALAVEDVTSKVTPCPKEISRHSSMKAFMQHMLLKTLSFAVITPFYSASLVETVQSDVASETAGFFDVFREGFWRLLSWPSTGRLVPLHVLIVPTVAHGILSYLIYTGVKSVSLTTIRRVRESKERKQGALSRDSSLSHYTEMTASLIGNMAADIILFPLETVLNRLHLQGTRTIIDSLENGFEVTPILTSYGGVLDCLRTTVDEEGFSGLYKGFGALVLQYGLQILIIRAVKIVVEKNPFGNNGAVSPPISEKYASTAYGTPVVHQSRSEPSNITSNNSRTPIDPLMNRRTPPTRDYAAENDTGEIRYRSRFTNFSPTGVR